MECPNGRPPELMEDNREVWQLWGEVQTQWRTSFAGRIGLDYSEVRHAARFLEIELSPCAWKKIQMLERMVISNDGKGAE